jgi:Ala-tRNA(Pro) deacylase
LYKLIDHEPEGTTETVSALRGHPVSEAAKCLILIVKIDRRVTRYVLAVVPQRHPHAFCARYLGFCDAAIAERLAHAVPGTVLPFSFDPELELVADPDGIAQPCLYFNAARLYRSLAISGADYARLTEPRVER